MLKDLLAYLDTKTGQHICRGAIILFSGLLLWSFWDFIGLFQQDNVSSAPDLTADVSQFSKLPDMTQWHLFGDYQQTSLDPNALPKSMLNLTVVGIFVGTPLQYSKVVIQDITGEQKLYGVGDTLDDDVKVYQILQDSVILEHQGHLEVLSLPKESINFGSMPRSLLFNKNN